MVYILLEFFAGGGMGRLGFDPERWVTGFANDISVVKAAAYRANFGRKHFLRRDVADVTIADLPAGRAECAWMSPPCVGHSEGGKRRGFDETESGSFWPCWALIEGLNAEGRAPRTIVFENVTGIKPENLRAVEQVFDRAGYAHATVKIDARQGSAIARTNIRPGRA
jgi:DNA (cytosine-5)-methyltransferase 1